MLDIESGVTKWLISKLLITIDFFIKIYPFYSIA